jgi:CBS domain containing-hemolysin-like protein
MTAALLAAVVVLIFVNGFFVAAEFALVRAGKPALEALQADGDKRAIRALAQLDDLSEYLSACQFGVTLASLGIGFLGEPAVAELFEPLLGNAIGHAAGVIVAIAIAYILITSFHITIGEQVPKIFAIVRPEAVAIRVARPLGLFATGMRPFIRALDGASNALLRVVGIDVNAVHNQDATPEELRAMIQAARVGGSLDAGEATMLSGVFQLHEQQARHVMTPIPAVVTVDVSETVEAGMRRCISSGHTRLLVTMDHDTDHVAGIVHANQLASALLDRGPEVLVDGIARVATIVPESRPIDDVLADLQRDHASMAVVADEYGRVLGIITVEDIVEEVVGEIQDETDPAAGAVRQLPSGDWYVRGYTPVADLADYGILLPPGGDEYTSVGGLVFTRLGRLPRQGENLYVDGYSLRVESVRDNRVEAVRVRERGPRAQAALPI